MKKVLLATTALVMMAGVANAEVAVSGDARFGFQAVEGNDEITVERRARIKFAGSGEADNGLTFGASFRSHLDATDGNDTNTGNVYISGAFGTLSVGSESSAAEYAVGDLADVGFTGAGSYNETEGFGGASIVYTYSADTLTAMVSIGEEAGNGGEVLDSDSLALGVSYTAGDLTVAAGYENGDDAHMIAGITYAMGDTKVKAIYGDEGDVSEMGVSVAHTMGAISLAGFYRQYDDVNSYGVGAAYDLGGGAAVKAGYADNEDDGAVAEVGVTFSF